MDDRGQAPDGYPDVGNGSLTRQSGRPAGVNGTDPALEELVSSWRRRANGLPPEDEGEPPVARGRAEVPGGAFAGPPAEVTPVTPNPPIPQQPGPPEATHHFPSAYPPVPGEEQPVYPPQRRPERPHYDERIRYQRPFRFRQRQDDRHGTTGRAEAHFGPAEFGPPEYSPPNYGPVDHRPTAPRAPEFGGPPRSPAPWGAGTAPYGVGAPGEAGYGAGEGAPAPYAPTDSAAPPEEPTAAFGWAPQGPPPVASALPLAPALPPPEPPAATPEPPAVPAPLIPPAAPASEAVWAAGPWTSAAAFATTPAAGVGGRQAGPAPPAPPISAGQPAPPGQHAPQLPQRIPAEPDVPAVPGDDDPEGSAEIPDIARIVDYLRDEELADERRDGFDFPAVIEAVRGVVGVRDAELVTVDNTHTLRLDLADDANPGEVSRAVARLLKEQMGVSAEPSPVEQADRTAPEARSAPPVEPVAPPVEMVAVPAEPVTAPVEPVAVPAEPVTAPVEPVAPPAEPVAAVETPGAAEVPAVAEVPAPIAEAPSEDQPDELAEPAELVPAALPLPARLADLPRIGEAPPAESVRVGAVPSDATRARNGRSGQRPLEARLAALEPALSFDDWLETVRPDRPEQRVRAATADEHRSLVGMPMVPVFNDPLAEEPEPEPATEPQLAVPVTEAEPVAAPEPAPEPPPAPAEAATEEGGEESAGPLVLAPRAPAVQVAGTGGRLRLEQVEVVNQGFDAVVHVRLAAGEHDAVGTAAGPAVDQYVLRLCATAAASALDTLLTDTETGMAGGRCYVEHATVMSLGTCEVAVVVMLLASGGWVEQLTGSAMVAGDARQAIVRATLAAANRRLDALLP